MMIKGESRLQPSAPHGGGMPVCTSGCVMGDDHLDRRIKYPRREDEGQEAYLRRLYPNVVQLRPGVTVVNSGTFVRGFRPPDYLLDGILQCGFFYSFTGATGS